MDPLSQLISRIAYPFLRIAMGIVHDPERKDAFMALMKSALESFFSDRGTPIETWNEPEAAPESERSGSA